AMRNRNSVRRPCVRGSPLGRDPTPPNELLEPGHFGYISPVASSDQGSQSKIPFSQTTHHTTPITVSGRRDGRTYSASGSRAVFGAHPWGRAGRTSSEPCGRGPRVSLFGSRVDHAPGAVPRRGVLPTPCIVGTAGQSDRLADGTARPQGRAGGYAHGDRRGSGHVRRDAGRGQPSVPRGVPAPRPNDHAASQTDAS